MRRTINDMPILVIRRLEDHALVVAFAMALAFDAVLAYWSLLAALDPSFPTS